MNKGKRGSKLLKGIIILLIGMILFFSSEKNQDKFMGFINSVFTSKQSEVQKESSLQVINSISTDNPIEEIAYHDDNIAVWGSNKLAIYDLQGSKKWEKEFNLNNPHFYAGNERLYVYDRDIGDIYSFNFYGNTLGRIQMGNKIKSISESKESLIVHSVEDNNEVLKILNFNGQVIDTRTVEDKILTYCIDDANKAYGICTLSLADDGIRTEIKLYEIKGDLITALHLEDQISLYIEFIGENKLLVLTDKGLYFVEDGIINWEKELEEVKDVYVDLNKTVNVLAGNTLESIFTDGRVKNRYSFFQDYNRIIPFKNLTVLWGPNHIVGLDDEKEIFKYETEDEIYDVVGGNQNLIVAYKNRIDWISYK